MRDYDSLYGFYKLGQAAKRSGEDSNINVPEFDKLLSASGALTDQGQIIDGPFYESAIEAFLFGFDGVSI